jgi:hypothetical protein
MLFASLFLVVSASAQPQSYSWGPQFSATPLANGDIDITVPATGDQLVGSPNKPELNSERFPSTTKIVIHIYYGGGNAKGEHVTGDYTVSTVVDWTVNAMQHVIFPASKFNFQGVAIIHVTPKCPGYNTGSNDEAVWLNYNDPAYEHDSNFGNQMVGYYACLYDADHKKIGRVSKKG